MLLTQPNFSQPSGLFCDMSSCVLPIKRRPTTHVSTRILGLTLASHRHQNLGLPPAIHQQQNLGSPLAICQSQIPTLPTSTQAATRCSSKVAVVVMSVVGSRKKPTELVATRRLTTVTHCPILLPPQHSEHNPSILRKGVQSK